MIRRRFDAGPRNLFSLYKPLLDAWWLYDAFRLPPTTIAGEEGGQSHVVQTDLYNRISQSVKGEP